MNSIWKRTEELPRFPTLKKNLKTEVLIIGGGMAGILTAYRLHQEGIPYILVEKGRIGGGVTENTTAKITVQHGLIYQKLVKNAGVDGARMYLDANQRAFDRFDELCRKVDCDYQRKDHFVYSVNNREKIKKELEALQKIGYQADFCKRLPLPFQVAGAVKFPDQAQFHPLKFLSFVAKGLHIYENTFVREMVGTVAKTDHAAIQAEKVIVTTHFPFLNKHGSYFLKLYQHRSYVLALEGGPEVGGMYVDESNTGLSFRNYRNFLLLGGGGHRTGAAGGNWAELRHFAKLHYPGVKERFFWATQDCMSLDGIPYIGQYSKNTPNLFVASGFNKWGMTGAMTASMVLGDLVRGQKNEFARIFDPSRSILKPQLAVNGFESVKNLLTVSQKRCPHLGCALKWNAAEHTWDCPCHGSRFSKDGKLLDNPANGDLK